MENYKCDCLKIITIIKLIINAKPTSSKFLEKYMSVLNQQM